MKDPFCKNEPPDPEIEKMVNRLKRANDLDIPAWKNAPYPPETPLWERQAVIASEIHIPEPWNVRGCPVGTRLEVKNRCRGKYVGEGFLIVDMEYMCSMFSDSPFIREWRTVNSHRVAIQPEWKVERI
jgi:hypothetical protein